MSGIVGAAGGLDRTSQALDAFKSGKGIDEALGLDQAPPAEEEEGTEVEAAPEQGSEDSSKETSEEDSPSEVKSDVEELILTDENGKRKLTIDWNNRDAIKKQIQLAAGARKWQAEKDKLSKELTTLKAEVGDKVSSYDQLDKAWKTHGVEGVLSLLGGEKGLTEYKQRLIAEANFLASASPEQKKAYEIERALENERREKQRLIDEQKATLEKISKDREEAAARQFESIVNPAFEKYRFKGKLGDEATEHHFDQAIWTQTLARLETLPEESLTASTIEKEFRAVAAAFNKAIGKQANEKAKQVVESKKTAAKEAVSQAAAKGMKETKSNGEVRDKISKGNLAGAFLDMINGKKL
jgi:hypothetical protein